MTERQKTLWVTPAAPPAHTSRAKTHASRLSRVNLAALPLSLASDDLAMCTANN